MNIEYKTPWIPIDEIEEGETFYYDIDRKIFLKTNEYRTYSDIKQVFCVRIEDGHGEWFAIKGTGVPVKTKVVEL